VSLLYHFKNNVIFKIIIGLKLNSYFKSQTIFKEKRKKKKKSSNVKILKKTCSG
jgi:hypothetical protein